MYKQLKWLCATALLLIVSSPVMAQDARDRLPAGAALAIFYNGDAPLMDKTALAEIWNEPGVKEFFEPVREAARAALRAKSAADPGTPDFAALEPALKARAAFALYPPAAGGKPQGVLAVDAGLPTSPVRVGIQKALQKVKGEPALVGAVPVTKISPDTAYCVVDQVFVLGDMPVLERFFDAGVARLTALPLYQEMTAQLDLGKEVVGCVVDNAALQQCLGPELNAVHQFLKVAGLDRMKGAALTWAPKGRGMMTSFYVSTPTDSGIVAALAAKPVDPQILRLVPKNVHAMYAFNLNATKLYDGIMTAIGAAAGPEALEDAKNAVAEFEMQNGVQLRDQFLASLDEGTAVAIQEGGMFMPNITVIQKVKDPAQADQSLAKLLTLAGAFARQAISGMMAPGAPPPPEPAAGAEPREIHSVLYNGVTIKYDDVAVISPAYAIKDGYLFLAASPVEMKDFLDGLGKSSILENPDWTFVRGQIPLASPQYLYYGDFKEAMRKSYYLLPTVAALVNSIASVPVKVDSGKLPGAERVASHLFGAASACELTPTGLKVCTFSPTGTEAPMTQGMMPAMSTYSAIPSLLMQHHAVPREMGPLTPAPDELFE